MVGRVRERGAEPTRGPAAPAGAEAPPEAADRAAEGVQRERIGCKEGVRPRHIVRGRQASASRTRKGEEAKNGTICPGAPDGELQSGSRRSPSRPCSGGQAG